MRGLSRRPGIAVVKAMPEQVAKEWKSERHVNKD